MSSHALVVGGSSDIGQAIAQELAACGYEVSLWGARRSRVNQALARLAEAGTIAHGQVVDVRDRNQVHAATDAVVARGDLRCLVWAAGRSDWANPTDADPARWDAVLDVNLQAAAYLVAHLSPVLVDHVPSSLVFIGSGADHAAYPHNAAYVASKHGLRGLSEALWADLGGQGVKVSLVSPGTVNAGTGLEHPAAPQQAHLWLQPADIAAAVRFVVTYPPHACPVEVRLESHQRPG